MPFYSKDWRSPGEAWVKTEEGWERLKMLECVKRKRLPLNDSCEETIPPHCRIIMRSSREIAGFNDLGDVLRRLDFRNSVRDRRRFKWLCSLLRLLVAHKGVANLPGNVQKQLLQMVEEVASHVSDSQQNLNVLRGLALQLQNILYQENQKCWGKPLGSTFLWQEHVETIKRIQNMATQIQIKEPGQNSRTKLHDLPEECVREIVLRIADHKDLEAAASAWNLMATLISEQRIWRELVQFHFNKKQIDAINDLNKFNFSDNYKDWRNMFHKLRRTYGINDDYQHTEALSLCRYCCCLFWPSDGHPCIVDQCPIYKQRLEEAGAELVVFQTVPPAQFLNFFSL